MLTLQQQLTSVQKQARLAGLELPTSVLLADLRVTHYVVHIYVVATKAMFLVTVSALTEEKVAMIPNGWGYNVSVMHYVPWPGIACHYAAWPGITWHYAARIGITCHYITRPDQALGGGIVHGNSDANMA